MTVQFDDNEAPPVTRVKQRETIPQFIERPPAATNRIYVGDLPDEAGENEVSEMFAEFGEVFEVEMMDHFAFVHMLDSHDVDLAIAKLDGTIMGDSTIRVERHRPKTVMSNNAARKKDGTFVRTGACRNCGSTEHWQRECPFQKVDDEKTTSRNVDFSSLKRGKMSSVNAAVGVTPKVRGQFDDIEKGSVVFNPKVNGITRPMGRGAFGGGYGAGGMQQADNKRGGGRGGNRGGGGGAGRGKGSIRERVNKGNCFVCQDPNHIAKDCPKNQQPVVELLTPVNGRMVNVYDKPLYPLTTYCDNKENTELSLNSTATPQSSTNPP